MKLYVILLKVVLVVFIEAVLSDGEGGASSGTVATYCLQEPDDENNLNKVLELPFPCIEELSLRGIYQTPEEQRHVLVEGICQKESRFKECLAEQASRLEVCPDPNMLNVFNIMRDLLEHMLEFGCIQNGERFKKLFSGTTKPNNNQIHKCFFRHHTVMKSLHDNKVDLPTKIFISHNEITPLKECLSKAGLDLPMQESLDRFIEETISTMKCIHPKDGNLVTCASIDPAEVSFFDVCDVKTKHGKLSIYEVLEDDALMWFEHFITRDQHDDDQEDITLDNEKLRGDFKAYCSVKGILISHLDGVYVVADICSNETDKNELSLLAENLISALDRACVEDNDNRLADVMFEVYRLKRTSPDHPHAVLKCAEAARATRYQSDDHRSSSKNMRFYHEMETFKECLVNEVRGDQASVNAANSLFNEIRSLVKCVKPEDGTTVLCESLMHTHQ